MGAGGPVPYQETCSVKNKHPAGAQSVGFGAAGRLVPGLGGGGEHPRGSSVWRLHSIPPPQHPTERGNKAPGTINQVA